jgi:hypothetical protein
LVNSSAVRGLICSFWYLRLRDPLHRRDLQALFGQEPVEEGVEHPVVGLEGVGLAVPLLEAAEEDFAEAAVGLGEGPVCPGGLDERPEHPGQVTLMASRGTPQGVPAQVIGDGGG